jgi:rhomboid protease GluP
MNPEVAEQPQPKKSWYKIRLFSNQFAATPVIISINILIFIAMVINGASIVEIDSQMLLEWGADYRLNTLDGEQWRLFTSTFIHIGIIHLVMNMYALFYIGSMVEPHLGPLRFTLVYVACGLLASLTSIAMHDDTVSVGASGAIFGIFGLYLALLLTRAINTDDTKKALYNMLIFLGYNLLFGMKAGVDNAAHIGGLLTGFLIGVLCKSDLVKEEGYRRGYVNISLTSLAIAGVLWMGLSMIPNNIKFYMEQMKIFDSRQNQALEIYTRLQSSSKEELIYEINERGIYYWQENLKVLKELQKLSLPDPIEERNKQLEK